MPGIAKEILPLESGVGGNGGPGVARIPRAFHITRGWFLGIAHLLLPG
jgi:hypothetical protein